VVPVRREGKGAVGGIVHDVSQSGATLFVEPPMAINLMNEVRDLEREEGREVRRILGELPGR
jgi:DNA mismatch repair protein MutS2